MKTASSTVPYQTALLYLGFAALWIIFSDRILESIVSSEAELVLYQTYKGLFFVAITGFLLYSFIRVKLSREEEATARMHSVEQRLHETEELYRLLYENSGEPILLTAPGGRISAANPAACRMLDRSEEEICRIGRDGIVDPNDPRLSRAAEEGRQTESFGGVMNFVRGDGRVFPGQVKTTLFRDSAGVERSSMIIREITDIEKLNVSLQVAKAFAEQSEEEKSTLLSRLREAQQTAKIGSWDWDLTTNAVWWSDELYHIVGADPQRYIPNVKANAAFIHPDDRSPYRSEIKRILEQGGSHDFDLRIITKEGIRKYCNSRGKVDRNAQGKPIRFSGTFMDITERKSVEEALRESEERWHFALEGPGDGVWDWNTVTNTVYFSRQWKVMLGYSEEEIGDRLEEWERRVHPDDLARVHEELDRHFRNETSVYQSEYRILCKDGAYRWILDRGKILTRSPEGKPYRMIGTHKDITEQKQSEELLRSSEERFRTTLDNMLEGAQILGFDWSYIYLNKTAERHNRRPSQELMGKKYMEMWPGIEKTEVFRLLKRCLEERTPQHMENEFVFPDGVTGWFNLSIQPIPEGIFILSVDITERKRAEEALIKNEEKYRSLIEHSPYAIFINQNGTVTYVNQACMRLFRAADKNALLGRDPLTLFHPEYYAAIRKRINDLLTTGKPAPMMEQRIVRMDGATVEVETIAVPFEIGNEKMLHVIMSDITERKRGEVRIKEQLAELQRWHEATLGRENRIIELKREVNELLAKASQPLRYASVVDEGEHHG